jgi:CP family cyanate transporter-like MFS transporter
MTSLEVDSPTGNSSATARSQASARLGIVLLVAALNLRIGVAALSPVLGDIQHDTGMSAAVAGLLNTVPVVCFGLFALSTPRLIRRFGMKRLLLLAMIVIAAGIALRLLSPLAALFAGTAVLGGGIAVGNVLLPGLIKQDFSRRASLMTGLYSVMLFVGAAISAGLTVPLEHVTGLGWRPTIALWGAPALLAAVMLVPFAAGRARSVRTGPAPTQPKGLWSDRVAWMVTGFMGLQSLGYYSALAWIPSVLEAHHMSASQAGWMLSYSSFPGLAASLATPLVIRGRAGRARAMVVAAIALCASGYLGLAAAPVSLPYLWLTLLGLGQGMCISLALGFIVARAPDVHHTAHLSTMAQSVGYLIASVGPFGLGALHDLTGEWVVPMFALTAVLIPLLIAGLGASRDGHVLSRSPLGLHDDGKGRLPATSR